mmetsp:Transcript_15048/g.60427  ORF Transcript_15048/g.60427 Transcript_15048/m.60427 type:complete len:215 (+) Transcript_15048:100-744(+)
MLLYRDALTTPRGVRAGSRLATCVGSWAMPGATATSCCGRQRSFTRSVARPMTSRSVASTSRASSGVTVSSFEALARALLDRRPRPCGGPQVVPPPYRRRRRLMRPSKPAVVRLHRCLTKLAATASVARTPTTTTARMARTMSMATSQAVTRALAGRAPPKDPRPPHTGQRTTLRDRLSSNYVAQAAACSDCRRPTPPGTSASSTRRTERSVPR